MLHFDVFADADAKPKLKFPNKRFHALFFNNSIIMNKSFSGFWFGFCGFCLSLLPSIVSAGAIWNTYNELSTNAPANNQFRPVVLTFICIYEMYIGLFVFTPLCEFCAMVAKSRDSLSGIVFAIAGSAMFLLPWVITYCGIGLICQYLGLKLLEY